MVFHNTNYVAETNAWWCRRVRPLWIVPTLMFIAGAGYRYYFFGKIQAYRNKMHTEEQKMLFAQINKRYYGYNSYYDGNNLARSRKAQIMKLLGDKYEPAESWAESYMTENRDYQTIMEEENSEKWDGI